MPSYLTTADVAARLGVSLDTVRRWLRSGELKGTPFGRAGYRIEDADFQAFLDQRRQHIQESSASSPEHALPPNIALEELMNTMGQELRTPLITTHGTLQQARRLLQRLFAFSLPDNAIDLATKLHVLLIQAERQVSAEMRLVGNVLDASRIETNTFELSPIWYNLVDIVREAVTDQQELADQKRQFELELPADDLVAVVVDADRIKQALTNYLANARKFSQVDQPIKISLQVKDRQACVSVHDNGPGIPASEQEKIWERFQQGQRQPEDTGRGMGLGLYVTKAIIQQHRGQVGVESHLGEGATFWFTLPLAVEKWH
jgi:excisionase family DNA binding protein